jgi:predicted 3-demethylubiquinone-9 3-methyltransferase (glyoxalase superfamily)
MEKTFYISKQDFITLTQTWAQKKSHTAAQHIIYNTLRSKPADLGFTEKTKNIQGGSSWYGYKRAWGSAHYLSRNNIWFKDNFGIDMPENMQEKLEGWRK